MGIVGLLFGSVGEAIVDSVVNDECQVSSHIQKHYKALERERRMNHVLDNLEVELKKINKSKFGPQTKLELKSIAFNTAFNLLGKTFSKQEYYAEHELLRHGRVGPIIRLAENEARLKGLIYKYL